MKQIDTISLATNLSDRSKRHLPSRNVSYPVRTFVEDHRQLVCRRDPRAKALASIREFIDGRWLAVRPTIRFDLDSRDCREYFVKKYGPDSASSFWSRFDLVLRFLADYEVELAKNGLAQGRAPMAVREEFIDFLLQYRLSEKQRQIPEAALRLYLDELDRRNVRCIRRRNSGLLGRLA
jgi:hypothetical protein